MQTLIKRHLIGLFALVLTVATMSFKMVNTSNPWYYDSEDDTEGAFAEVGNWKPGLGSYSCTDSYVKPCRITASNIGELETMLHEKNNDAVLGLSDSTRD